ncbi:hypothetical protein DH2020_013650 [Rehmannia glutinosa]|uniref:Protein MIZU-KUSSEI 1-like n=1 Tax=Rehmannia glutinosa TaxID=99300 RepID=A0ABR0X304_REHGL
MAKSMNNQRHNFHWTTKISNNEDCTEASTINILIHQEMLKKQKKNVKKVNHREEEEKGYYSIRSKIKLQAQVVSRLRSAVSRAFGNYNGHQSQQRVVLGTLFGNKRGHVHFAFQKDAKSQPALLIQLATPITGLVREMASGFVRIALECEKKVGKNDVALLEERVWRTYCNGVKYGLATRIECGPKEWRVLKAVEPISMGAGVLPDEEDEVIYMRAKFDRVMGSTDSQALYMVNPDDNNAAPELSIYLLRP